jgi:DNA-binding transcriptional LysR family regulator
MDFRQLEMFLAVVECGGYTNAGERLHISHSAIHRQIRLLEHELKDRVLVKVGARMELTTTGSLVLEHARIIRQDVTNFHRRIDEVVRLQAGYLRIGTGSLMLQFFLPPILQRFRKQFPGIDVHIVTGTANEVIDKMGAGNLDVGIIFGPLEHSKAEGGFNYEFLYREEFVWAVSKTNPLAKRKTASLAKILDYPLITYSKTTHVRRLLEHLFEKARLKPKVIMELESEESMERMVEMDMGVAFLALRRVMIDKIHFVRALGQPIYFEVGLISLGVNYIPGVVKEFARKCREANLKEQPSPNAWS